MLRLFLFLTAAGLLAAAFVNLRAFETRQVFPADRIRTSPREAGMVGFEDVRIRTADGETLVGWWRPPPPGAGVVLYLHGNGGSLADRAGRLSDLAASGLGVLAIDYLGYGGSTGRPSERGLHADAEAAYDWITVQSPARPLALVGESLGTGVAVRLAAERAVTGVVLDSAYASLPDLVRRRWPWLPAHLLMANRFESDRRIAAVGAPVLFVHCSEDDVTPLASARILHSLARNARFITLPGCGHVETWSDPRARTEILDTLRDWTMPGR